MKVFIVRARPLYRNPGRAPEARTAKGHVDLRQVHNMQRAVKAARAEGRISVADARDELATLKAMHDHMIASKDRKVGCRFAPADEEIKVRPKADQMTRRRRAAQREARKLGRPPKKKKRRKR